MAEYHVAVTGNNQASGTATDPWWTIQFGANKCAPGDVLVVHGGVHYERARITNGGIAEQPVTIMAAPGEEPIIDGGYTLPSATSANKFKSGDEFVYAPLLQVDASHVVIDGLTVRNSRGRGIGLTGAADNRHRDITIRNCVVHDIREAAAHTYYCDNVLWQDCDIYHGGNFYPLDRDSAAVNWPVACNNLYSTNVTWRGCKIFDNWGEGLAAGRGTVGMIVEDCQLWDNYGLQLYVHRSQRVSLRRNLIYHTNGENFDYHNGARLYKAAIFRRGGNPSQGIVLNNESNFAGDITVADVEIVANIVAGCRHNVAVWGSEGSDLPIGDVLVANNTFVNAESNQPPEAAGIRIFEINATGVIRFVNNVVYQNNGFKLAQVADNPALVFDHNAWSSAPPAAVTGDGDIVGDLGLANPDHVLVSGKVDPLWYLLAEDSRLVGRGTTWST